MVIAINCISFILFALHTNIGLWRQECKGAFRAQSHWSEKPENSMNGNMGTRKKIILMDLKWILYT